MIRRAHFILYVHDYDASVAFYAAVLGQQPTLHGPGMTEFRLAEGAVLGLMPVDGIRALLGERLDSLHSPPGAPRAEIYLYVDEPDTYHERALQQGAREISRLQLRNWGDLAGYVLDPEGNVIAFAARVVE